MENDSSNCNLKYGEIIKVNGITGIVVTSEENKKYFWDKESKWYSTLELPEINEYEETTHDEKVKFLIKDFPWGTVIDTHEFGEFLIFEFINN